MKMGTNCLAAASDSPHRTLSIVFMGRTHGDELFPSSYQLLSTAR
jgi:hypothetical protein